MNGEHGSKTAENTNGPALSLLEQHFAKSVTASPTRLICAVTFFTPKRSNLGEIILEAMAHLLRFCFDLSTRSQAMP